MNEARPIIPWGYPTQSGSDGSSWVTQWGPWLLIGALLLLGMASSGSSKK